MVACIHNSLPQLDTGENYVAIFALTLFAQIEKRYSQKGELPMAFSFADFFFKSIAFKICFFDN